MTKSAFDKIAVGLTDVGKFMKGTSEGFAVHIPEQVDVKAIRRSLKLSQPKFAATFGFSVGRVRDWEQGRFAIDPPSRAFLTVIEKEPEAVLRAIGTPPAPAAQAVRSVDRTRNHPAATRSSKA